MSHIINVDFQNRRLAGQELTRVPGITPSPERPAHWGSNTERYQEYQRLKRIRDAQREGRVYPRSTSEIWHDLYPLRMTGTEDEAKRKRLIQELQYASEPLDW